MLICFSHVQLFVTLWTVTLEARLSTGFSRQEYRSGLPFPSPGDLPRPRTEPVSLMSPASSGGFFTTSAAAGDIRDTGSIPGSGRWRATVQRVAKSHTRLKRISTYRQAHFAIIQLRNLWLTWTWLFQRADDSSTVCLPDLDVNSRHRGGVWETILRGYCCSSSPLPISAAAAKSL